MEQQTLYRGATVFLYNSVHNIEKFLCSLLDYLLPIIMSFKKRLHFKNRVSFLHLGQKGRLFKPLDKALLRGEESRAFFVHFSKTG